MAMGINTNVSSLNAQRNLTSSQNSLATSLQRLSSGLRINSAKDDAAGLAISERMTSQITGLNQAARNANDGVSLAQTAESDLGQITSNLQRVRELSVQSANATNSASDREALQKEVAQLVSEIDRVASQSSFNGVKLLDGSFSSQAFQVGANAGQTITVGSITSARTANIGGYTLTGGLAVDNVALAVGELSFAVGSAAAVSVGASVAGGGLGQSAGSAYAKALAINSAGTGVTATASTTAAGTTMVAAATTGTITINTVATASFSTGGVSAATDAATTISEINKISASTGVIASVDSTGGVKLTASDGRNIAVSLATHTSASTGVTSGTALGKLTLTSANATVTMGGTAAANRTGHSVGVLATSLSAVSSIDISTAAGATSALSALDGALQQINTNRADLGALQNRFSSVVTSLQASAENLSASRSRILDTDFAAETANMTKNQILQQAGTAMLAQANSLPQNVLSLLK